MQLNFVPNCKRFTRDCKEKMKQENSQGKKSTKTSISNDLVIIVREGMLIKRRDVCYEVIVITLMGVMCLKRNKCLVLNRPLFPHDSFAFTLIAFHIHDVLCGRNLGIKITTCLNYENLDKE